MERALALGARLTERDRMLVRAAHAYSFGSLDDAEALYRQLVTAYPEDVEAWYGLAEVLFHGGPFRGRPIAQAEPAFRRLLALNPEHFEGRLHLLRLLARHDGEVDVAEIDSLVATSRPLVASHPMSLLRLDALGAFVHDGADGTREVEAAIALLPENVAWELGAGLATTTGNLAAAARIFRALAHPGRPAPWRAIARMSLANVAVAEGRWGDARRELDAARREDPTLGLFAFASLATAPWLPLTPAERDSLRHALAAWRTPVPGAALAGALPQFADLLPAVRLLDLAELAALAGDGTAAQAYADSLSRLGPLASPIPATWALPADAKAAVALAANRAGDALAALDGSRPAPMLQSFPRSFVVTHGRERWTHAEALVAASRLREAQDWYGTFTCYLCLTDAPYEAPGWLRQARILEELGERKAARATYGRVLERWRRADDRFAPLVAQATAGLARTAGTP
jgi:tetratricopeptide (TPR) repeat protein